jgi:tRNA(Ile)-lysidine synthase
MLEAFIRFWKTDIQIPLSSRILLAVSGGADSMTMLHLFSRAGFRFEVAHVNFQLRGEDAVKDEAMVAEEAQHLNKICHCIRFQTQDYAAQKGISIEMAARELRYRWFEQICQQSGCDYIATAHHQDDVAETLLLHLLRKTGISGLHGIRVKNGNIIRPMLFTDRKKILAYVLQNGVPYREDYTNSQDRYLRNYIRLHIIPKFRTVEPNFTRILLESIAVITGQEDLYYHHVREIKNRTVRSVNHAHYIEIKDLKILPEPHLPVYLFEFIKPFGFNFAQTHALCRCLDSSQEKLFESPSFRLHKMRKRLEIHPLDRASIPVLRIEKEGEYLFDRFRIRIEIRPRQSEEILSASPDTAYFDTAQLPFPLHVRRWKKGDFFHPFGGKGKKKLSDFFTDHKLSSLDRERVPILCDAQDGILLIGGMRRDRRFPVTGKTEKMLVVRLLSVEGEANFSGHPFAQVVENKKIRAHGSKTD